MGFELPLDWIRKAYPDYASWLIKYWGFVVSLFFSSPIRFTWNVSFCFDSIKFRCLLANRQWIKATTCLRLWPFSTDFSCLSKLLLLDQKNNNNNKLSEYLWRVSRNRYSTVWKPAIDGCWLLSLSVLIQSNFVVCWPTVSELRPPPVFDCDHFPPISVTYRSVCYLIKKIIKKKLSEYL